MLLQHHFGLLEGMVRNVVAVVVVRHEGWQEVEAGETDSAEWGSGFLVLAQV